MQIQVYFVRILFNSNLASPFHKDNKRSENHSNLLQFAGKNRYFGLGWTIETMIIELQVMLFEILKVAFFRKCDVFFKSPNIQKHNMPNPYPELEI